MLSLELSTLCMFTNATASSRNMIEGQRVINSGMIIMCGASSKMIESIELYALCLQTSALTNEPHTITGQLRIKNLSVNLPDEEYSVSIDKMTCSCKAGTSQSCKHIVAVLLYCNRIDLNTLQIVSPTDKKCLWKNKKAPMLEQFEAQPTKTFCCINQKRLTPLPVHIQESIRNRLIDCHSDTAIAKHRYRNINNASSSTVSGLPLIEIQNINRHIPYLHQPNASQQIEKDYTECIVKNTLSSKNVIFLKFINYSLKDCCQNTYNTKIICKNVLRIAQSTKKSIIEWKKVRKFRVTGSRCYSLYTYSKDNWQEKARKYFWAKEFKSKYTHHGNKYENVARNKYSEENNLFIQECGLIVSESEPWMAYSPDGVVIKDNKVLRLIEIKCPYELENTTDEVLLTKCKTFLQLENNVLTLRKNHQYYGQIQFGMALLNLKDCDFIVYSNISNFIRVFHVTYDRQYAESLLTVLKQNYFQRMLHVICENSRVP